MACPAEPAVRLRGICKTYGRRAVLDEVSLDVTFGEVLGLVGPNGAGKTTLLGIMAGLVRPSAGTGQVLGQAVGPGARPLPFVGLMLEKPAFIEHLNGAANLKTLGAIRGETTASGIESALQEVGLDPKDRRPVRSYSQGMRQRLSLAQALMEHPQLLLLDEPTNALDPLGVIQLRSKVQAAADAGAAVLISSHLLAEVSAVCHRVVVVAGGRIVRDLPGAESGSSLEAEYLAALASSS